VESSELKELQDIKRLLMVLLLKAGGTPNDLAHALKVHPSRISQLLPVKKIKNAPPKG
jgi:hypothetical protein